MAIKWLYISSLASGSLPAARPEAARRLPPGTGCVASALAESGSGTWIHVLAGLAKEELTASCSLTLLTWLDINQGPPPSLPLPGGRGRQAEACCHHQQQDSQAVGPALASAALPVCTARSPPVLSPCLWQRHQHLGLTHGKGSRDLTYVIQPHPQDSSKQADATITNSP